MTYSIKKAFAILSLAIFGSVLLYNCEPDPDSLGEQLFLDGAAHGVEKSYDVIAYNINNNDSIRSDAAKLGLATLGAVKDEQFGKQRASYYTQLRLPSYSPDFGTNAAVDSVVLVIKPTYASDSITTTTNEDYIYPDGSVAAKKVVNTYPAIKYGRTKAPKLTIKVNEVTEFLNGASDIAYSNKDYSVGAELGRKDFTGTVNSVTITKDSDASSLFTSATGFRIPLSASFFKTKIIDKKGQPELSDVSNFIRYFKGLKLSVSDEDEDAYLMQFSPNDMELVMYYTNEKTENNITTRPQSTYTFAIGSTNAHIANYKYERSSQYSSNVLGNKELGDKKLYTQGMGGPSIGVRLPKETIDSLQQLYRNNKAAIISAKIRMYTDDATWTSKYAKPKNFTIVQRDINAKGVTTVFTADLLNLGGSNNFALYRAYDLDKNPTYYEFTVTKSVKDIIEVATSATDNKDRYFKIDMGSFLTTSDGSALAGYQYTSRSYAIDRAVFIGSDSPSVNKIKLKIIYGTK